MSAAEVALQELGFLSLPATPSRAEVADALDALASLASDGAAQDHAVLQELGRGAHEALEERGVLEAAPMVASALDGWPTKHEPGTPEPKPLPLDALPKVLQDMARTSHEATQAPLDSAIGAVLGGVSVAIVGKVEVEIRADTDWCKPAHEYIGIQQPSGTGKSPLINMVRKPIAAWEARKASEEASTRRWAAEQIKLAEKCVESARKDAVKDASLRNELEQALNELTDAESKPHGEFQLLLSDATEEEVVRVLAGNGGRAASVDPEGTILEVAAGRYGNGDARLAALTHGWDGETMLVNRVSRARINIPSANMALLLGLQPGILAGMVNAQTMRQKGVLARFLWIAPTLRWDELKTGRDVPALDQAAVTRYSTMITRLLDLSDKSEGGARVLKMSDEAQEGVYRLEQAKVDEIRPGGALQSVPAFAGKLPDHGSRIAALLTVADRADRGEDPFADPIPGWAMESAERLIAAISTHVVKVTGDAGADPQLSELRYLMERAVEMDGSTESDIREKARARQSFRDAEHARELFDELERRGCIRRIHQERGDGPGRDPSPRIEVHPTLQGSDKSDKRHRTLMTANKSDKSEVGVDELSDEDRLYLEDERGGMAEEDLEPVPDLFGGGD